MMPTGYPLMFGRQRQSTFMAARLRSALIAANFGTGITWTNMPSAQSDMYAGVVQDTLKQWYGSGPMSYNDYILWGTVIDTAGSANAIVKIQYSIDGGANWFDMEGPSSQHSISTTGQKLGRASLPADAKSVQDTMIRVVGEGGNAIADPAFGLTAGFNGCQPGVQPINFQFGMDNPTQASTLNKRREMIYFNFFWSFATQTWTNMPAALTEWFGLTTRRLTCNFFNPGSEMVKLVFNMSVTGSANAVMMLQYSLNGGASWQFIDSETTNTGAPCNIGATGWRQSASWAKVDAAAKVVGGTLCRLVGQNGDGVADPTFSGGSTARTMCVRWDPAT